MNASTDTVAAENAPADAPAADIEAAQIEAVKDRLRQTAELLCINEGYCNDAIRTIYGTEGFDLGRRPGVQFYDTSIELVVNGKARTVTNRFETYSQRAADWYATKALGFTDDLEPLDSSEDTDAVKAFKERIYLLAERSTGSINRGILNKYLRFMGVRELPVEREFKFQVELEPPSTHATYTVKAYTAEDALAAVKRQVSDDEYTVSRGAKRLHGKGNLIGTRKAVEGAEPTLVEPVAETAAA